MKKLLSLLLLCFPLIAVCSNQLPVRQGLKQETCSDSLRVSADVSCPVKFSFTTIGYGPDGMDLAIYAEDSTTIISTFRVYVVTRVDTTFYLAPGKYYLAYVGGGANIKGPDFSGENVSVSPDGWKQMTNFIAMPFKVFQKAIVCSGQSILNAKTYYNGTGKLNYKWTPSTGLNSDTVQSPVASVSENTTYRVTVSSSNGCIAIDSLQINVSPLTVNCGADKVVVCGGSVQLNTVTTNYNGSGKLRYKWTPSTGLNNDTIAQPIVNVTSNITYNLTVTAPSGCTATDDIKVTVAPFTANAGADKTSVSGGTITLNAVTTNYAGAGRLKYKWTPATGLNNDTIAAPRVTALTNVTYTVTVTAPEGCTASDNVAVNIIPMAKPVLGIVGVNASNKNIVVWNKPVSTGIASYSVYKETSVTDVFEKIGSVSYDSLSVFVDNQSNPNVKSNKYKLSIVDRSNLESPLSNAHKTMHLSINKGQNNTWNLIWEPYEGFTVSTYNIYRGTSPLTLGFVDAVSGSSTQYSDLDAPAGDVYYQLEVISPLLVSPTKVSFMQKLKASETNSESALVSFNSSRSNIATNVLSGLSNPQQDNNMEVYPQPFKDRLMIESEGGSTFELLNVIGQVVYTGDLNVSNQIQTSNLNPGTYLIKLKKANSYVYKKVIKK